MVKIITHRSADSSWLEYYGFLRDHTGDIIVGSSGKDMSVIHLLRRLLNKLYYSQDEGCI